MEALYKVFVVEDEKLKDIKKYIFGLEGWYGGHIDVIGARSIVDALRNINEIDRTKKESVPILALIDCRILKGNDIETFFRNYFSEEQWISFNKQKYQQEGGTIHTRGGLWIARKLFEKSIPTFVYTGYKEVVGYDEFYYKSSEVQKIGQFGVIEKIPVTDPNEAEKREITEKHFEFVPNLLDKKLLARQFEKIHNGVISDLNPLAEKVFSLLQVVDKVNELLKNCLNLIKDGLKEPDRLIQSFGYEPKDKVGAKLGLQMPKLDNVEVEYNSKKRKVIEVFPQLHRVEIMLSGYTTTQSSDLQYDFDHIIQLPDGYDSVQEFIEMEINKINEIAEICQRLLQIICLERNYFQILYSIFSNHESYVYQLTHLGTVQTREATISQLVERSMGQLQQYRKIHEIREVISIVETSLNKVSTEYGEKRVEEVHQNMDELDKVISTIIKAPFRITKEFLKELSNSVEVNEDHDLFPFPIGYLEVRKAVENLVRQELKKDQQIFSRSVSMDDKPCYLLFFVGKTAHQGGVSEDFCDKIKQGTRSIANARRTLGPWLKGLYAVGRVNGTWLICDMKRFEPNVPQVIIQCLEAGIRNNHKFGFIFQI